MAKIKVVEIPLDDDIVHALDKINYGRGDKKLRKRKAKMCTRYLKKADFAEIFKVGPGYFATKDCIVFVVYKKDWKKVFKEILTKDIR